MKGHIRQKAKGSWQIQIYIGTGPDGKPLRHFETVRGCKSDAQHRLTELLSSLDKGVYTPPGRVTVAEHLHQMTWSDKVALISSGVTWGISTFKTKLYRTANWQGL